MVTMTKRTERCCTLSTYILWVALPLLLFVVLVILPIFLPTNVASASYDPTIATPMAIGTTPITTTTATVVRCRKLFSGIPKPLQESNERLRTRRKVTKRVDNVSLLLKQQQQKRILIRPTTTTSYMSTASFISVPLLESSTTRRVHPIVVLSNYKQSSLQLASKKTRAAVPTRSHQQFQQRYTPVHQPKQRNWFPIIIVDDTRIYFSSYTRRIFSSLDDNDELLPKDDVDLFEELNVRKLHINKKGDDECYDTTTMEDATSMDENSTTSCTTTKTTPTIGMNSYENDDDGTLLMMNPTNDHRNSTATANTANNNSTVTFVELWFQKLVSVLAKLSLEDSKWRMNLFRQNEADRMMEVSLARMRGEHASYVRPMDARMDYTSSSSTSSLLRTNQQDQQPQQPTLGPLGQMEYNAVSWLVEVIMEESKRAQAIIDRSGKLIRPLDVRIVEEDPEDATGTTTTTTATRKNLGPLGRLEQMVVEFVQQIQTSEEYRVKIAKTIRPKDVVPTQYRGPLGEWEYQVTMFLQQLRESEELRFYLQSKHNRNHQNQIPRFVRPIDVPGPLGELERNVGTIVQAEKRRVQEQKSRPKDASIPGPLGDAEKVVVQTLEQVNYEERERLKSIQRAIVEKLQQQQPQSSSSSFFSTMETIVVGIIRGPVLLWNVCKRVYELLFETKTIHEILMDSQQQQILSLKKEQHQQTDKTKVDDTNKKPTQDGTNNKNNETHG